MVSDKLKLRYLAMLSDTEPTTVKAICKELEKIDGRVRLELAAMEALGIVKKVNLSETDGNQHRGPKVGWIRLISPPSQRQN
jgi:hypothetical protein